MAKGNLVVHLSDMAGELVKGRVDIDLRRVDGSNGAGGEHMEVSVTGPVGRLTITGIACQAGPGTMYEVRASTSHYRKYAFFQLVREDRDNTASDDVEFWIRPGDVVDIQAPPFADLSATARAILDQAAMIADKPEDRDLVGLSGKALYQQMGPLRKACPDSSLHPPPQGFAESREGSFKSRDPHANLQVTFMTEIATGGLVADIDIDESAGIKHGLEVIGNAAFKKRTNPYLIREFLNAADFAGHSLDPGYRFTF